MSSQLCQVFFTADAVLHVEGEWPELDVEKTTRRVPWPVQNIGCCDETVQDKYHLII